MVEILLWSAAHAAYNDGGIMRLLSNAPRPLAMSMALAAVPQIVDEVAPLREYPPRHPHKGERDKLTGGCDEQVH
jgi:hypothetical protein